MLHRITKPTLQNGDLQLPKNEENDATLAKHAKVKRQELKEQWKFGERSPTVQRKRRHPLVWEQMGFNLSCPWL